MVKKTAYIPAGMGGQKILLVTCENICQLWKMYKYSDKCILNVIIIFKHNFLILFTKYLNIFIAICIIYITVPVCLNIYIFLPPLKM